MARTRSQSREPSVEPRLANRHARTVGEEIARSGRQAQQQLEPLPEGPSETGDDDSRQQLAASGDENEEMSDSDSAPIETFSQTELQILDPIEMESNLEELNARARRLLGCFKIRTGQPDELKSLIHESQDPDSRQRQKADDCRAVLEETRAIFTRGGEYLKVDTILRGLLRKRNTQPLPKVSRPWRPDDVICKANLAILVHTFMTQSTDEGLVDALLSLDASFPSPFVVGFTRPGAQMRAGYSALVEATFEFALELRAQLLVGMLDGEMPQDAAAEMIQNVMLNFDENDDDYEEEMGAILSLQTALSHNRHAKGWEFLDPHAFETSAYADKIIQRTEEITGLLFSDIEDRFADSSASLASGLIKLRESFPPERFQNRLLQWSNLRLLEIDNSIKKLGGIDEIITALEDEIRERLVAPDAYVDEDEEEQEALPSIESNIRATPNAPSVPASSTKIPARPSVLFRGRPGTSTAQPISATAREDLILNTAQDNFQVADDITSSAGLTQDRPRLTGKLARANALDEQERQKRRFIDAQPNGVRIVDDLLASQPALDTQEQATGRHEIELDPTLDGDVQDPSEDEGFQTDQRNLPSHRPTSRPSAVSRQVPAPAVNTQPERRRRSPESDSPNKRQRKNPGQLVIPFQSTGDEIIDSFKVAHARTRQIHASSVKPQRGRKPWTDAEVGALLRLIRDYGKSFAMIKRIDEEKEDPELGERTAEDLRFKAREIKVKFLIAQRPLPENLEQVPLGKKEIEKVNQHVFYEQAPQRSRARISTVSPRRSKELE
ncbi:hypothetical protein QM012_002329 [Aureobasidium pullulans]|uniref:Myb-like domain-containing protein n=1 Tax=Aureobasidium pullulans TaxID=5580 RepID=A0ABR0TC56_AURPU